MQRCEHCGVTVRGRAQICPLCQNLLTGINSDAEYIFPKKTPPKPIVSLHALTWLGFFTVCAAAICVCINLILPAKGWWSLFVVAGFFCLWADFGLIMRKRRNLQKTIVWQVAFISIIAYLWDRFTGHHGWAVDYVLPIMCTGAMVSMFLLARIQKLQIQDYILYLGMVCILGLGALILILTDTVRIAIPMAICFCTSVAFLAFLIFFEGRVLKAELQRRFHL